jgi:hypothetical protein
VPRNGVFRRVWYAGIRRQVGAATTVMFRPVAQERTQARLCHRDHTVEGFAPERTNHAFVIRYRCAYSGPNGMTWRTGHVLRSTVKDDVHINNAVVPTDKALPVFHVLDECRAQAF